MSARFAFFSIPLVATVFFSCMTSKVASRDPHPSYVVGAEKNIVYLKTRKQLKKEKEQAAMRGEKATISPVFTVRNFRTPGARKDTILVVDTATNKEQLAVLKLDSIASKDSVATNAPSFSPEQGNAQSDSDTVKTNVTYSREWMESFVRPAAQLKKFSVVTGSYRTLQEAFPMVVKLKKANYCPLVVKNETGKYRVITGTYNDREEADIDVMSLEMDAIPSWVLIR